MDQSPNTFRKPEEPTVVNTVTPPAGGGGVADATHTVETERPIVAEESRFSKLAPVISLVLGLLLVTGGIVYGLKQESKNKPTIVNLPDFVPATSQVTQTDKPAEDTGSAAGSEKTTVIAPKPPVKPAVAPKVADKPVGTASVKSQSLPQPKAVVRTVIKPVTKEVNVPVQNESANLPEYQPTYALPEYQPVVVLADYQPQYVETISVRLQIAGGASYAVKVAPGSTVLAMMNELKKQGLGFKTQSFSFGEQVIELNGQGQGNGSYWLYALNGQCAKYGISQQTLKEGDLIVWALNHC